MHYCALSRRYSSVNTIVTKGMVLRKDLLPICVFILGWLSQVFIGLLRLSWMHPYLALSTRRVNGSGINYGGPTSNSHPVTVI